MPSTRFRALLFFCLVFFYGRGWVLADEKWTVDGVWLGARAEQVPRPLQPHHFLKGLRAWEGERFLGYCQEAVWLHPGDGVVMCEGKELRLGSQVVLRTGDKIKRVKQLFGGPDGTSGAFEGCASDPCYWLHYKRAGGVLSILVSNDDFIRYQFPKETWPQELGKVWSVRLRSSNLNELVQKSFESLRKSSSPQNPKGDGRRTH